MLRLTDEIETIVRETLKTAAPGISETMRGTIVRSIMLKATPAIVARRPAEERDAAIALAYGLLWLCPSDRATVNGERIYQARQALLQLVDRDTRLGGLKAAQDLLAGNQERIPDR